jgi:hypothetical protein
MAWDFMCRGTLRVARNDTSIGQRGECALSSTPTGHEVPMRQAAAARGRAPTLALLRNRFSFHNARVMPGAPNRI